ncbi:sulfate transporter 3 protein [Dioscorea alata]|uniref:Sulfate transporter 3 protein n=1 Tax=Dioscorea alata TaxID=55571 RepID=A0ACB7WF85_DIOAL|nr:sulfate transporter 3 protein [Dioscorea alata]
MILFATFRGLPPHRKAFAFLKYFAPILEWGPKYKFTEFKFDLLAGITIASMAIPQGISYARLAGLPPIIGLYSSFVPPLIYAVFGSSKNVAIGTVGAASLLLQSIIQQAVLPANDAKLYMNLFFTAAFFTGVFQTAMGIFRLGFLVDFLSRSTITGFMGGTAILIILQQLKGMLGMQHFTDKTDVVSVIHAVFHYRADWQWQSFVVGLIFLTFLLGTRHLKKKVPRLFWVSAISPLVVVILGGLLAFLVKGDEHGIPIVGTLNKGLNPISIGDLVFTSPYLSYAVKAGLIAGFIALAEGIAVGRSLGLLKNEQVDGNKEMIAFGLMNIGGSFTSCYLTTAPFSKSAVNFHAGSKTAMSNVIQAIIIMLVLLFLAPLFKYTPLVALAAIIIVAMIGLIEFEEMYHLFKVDKFDFCVCMVAFFGVSFLSMFKGLLISVGLSLIRALIHVARPTTSKLGKLDVSEMYRDIEQYPEAQSQPGILILKLGSPIYFANATYLRERISRWVEEELSSNKNGSDLQYIIFDMGGVTSIDSSGLGMFHEVRMIMSQKGIKMALSNPRLEVVGKLVSSKFIEMISAEWVFLSIKDAVSSCNFALQELRTGPEHV